MPDPEFVPASLDVPAGLVCDAFRLLPLRPEHNEADYAAWTSSMDHIRTTPGFEGRDWPAPMPKEDNLRDLEGHAQDFRLRRGFTYTVEDPFNVTIGCVYIYPSTDADSDADVRLWVRADHAELDRPLYEAVSAWLQSSWPFGSFSYAPRQELRGR